MRILFVKTSSLGDVLHQCPAVTDTRARFPQATIDWVVEDTFAGIAEMHPAVRRVIPIGIRRWRTRIARPSVWAEMLGIRRTLRDEMIGFHGRSLAWLKRGKGGYTAIRTAPEDRNLTACGAPPIRSAEKP